MPGKWAKTRRRRKTRSSKRRKPKNLQTLVQLFSKVPEEDLNSNPSTSTTISESLCDPSTSKAHNDWLLRLENERRRAMSYEDFRLASFPSRASRHSDSPEQNRRSRNMEPMPQRTPTPLRYCKYDDDSSPESYSSEAAQLLRQYRQPLTRLPPANKSRLTLPPINQKNCSLTDVFQKPVLRTRSREFGSRHHRARHSEPACFREKETVQRSEKSHSYSGENRRNTESVRPETPDEYQYEDDFETDDSEPEVVVRREKENVKSRRRDKRRSRRETEENEDRLAAGSRTTSNSSIEFTAKRPRRKNSAKKSKISRESVKLASSKGSVNILGVTPPGSPIEELIHSIEMDPIHFESTPRTTNKKSNKYLATVKRKK